MKALCPYAFNKHMKKTTTCSCTRIYDNNHQRLITQAIFVFDKLTAHFSEYYVNLAQTNNTEHAQSLCIAQQFRPYINSNNEITRAAAALIQQLTHIEHRHFDDVMYSMASILREDSKVTAPTSVTQAIHLLHNVVHSQFSLLQTIQYNTHLLQYLPIQYNARIATKAHEVNCVRISAFHSLSEQTKCVSINMFSINTAVSRNTQMHAHIARAQNAICSTWSIKQSSGHTLSTYVSNDNNNLLNTVSYTISILFIFTIIIQVIFALNKRTNIIERVRNMYRSVRHRSRNLRTARFHGVRVAFEDIEEHLRSIDM